MIKANIPTLEYYNNILEGKVMQLHRLLNRVRDTEEIMTITTEQGTAIVSALGGKLDDIDAARADMQTVFDATVLVEIPTS